MFATHFHELTTLESTLESVVNLHVSAHTTESSITMLYNILPGPAECSYGILVAQIAQFPEKVLESAKKKAQELENQQQKAIAVDGAISSAQRMSNIDVLKKVGAIKIEGRTRAEKVADLQAIINQLKESTN
jgi:DNA mismatch repair ATPase MutS